MNYVYLYSIPIATVYTNTVWTKYTYTDTLGCTNIVWTKHTNIVYTSIARTQYYRNILPLI